MTQIVYNGRYLLADRRCTYGYYTTIEAPKVFKIQVGDIMPDTLHSVVRLRNVR